MNPLKELFTLFFRMGLVAFGGPAAHIAMLHKEVVDKRKWMSEEHFLDLMGATSLIPGPNSTEMVIHTGFHRSGKKGLIIAGLSFILPACLLTWLLAYLYTLGSSIPNFEMYIFGIKPVVLIIIFQALRKLQKKAIKSFELAIVAFIVLAFSLYGFNQVLVLLLGAIIGFSILKTRSTFSQNLIPLDSIFWIFLKVGATLFGSGYVLVTYLQKELIDQRLWLSTTQLADAIAFGQFTPGPVLSTSTFIGYLLAGSPGAVLATIGIFLPSFLFVLVLNPLIPKMRDSKNFALVLDSVNASAMGLMAYALYPLGKASFLNTQGIVIFLATLLIIYKWPKMNSMNLVGLGLFQSILWTLFIQ